MPAMTHAALIRRKPRHPGLIIAEGMHRTGCRRKRRCRKRLGTCPAARDSASLAVSDPPWSCCRHAFTRCPAESRGMAPSAGASGMSPVSARSWQLDATCQPEPQRDRRIEREPSGSQPWWPRSQLDNGRFSIHPSIVPTWPSRVRVAGQRTCRGPFSAVRPGRIALPSVRHFNEAAKSTIRPPIRCLSNQHRLTIQCIVSGSMPPPHEALTYLDVEIITSLEDKGPRRSGRRGLPNAMRSPESRYAVRIEALLNGNEYKAPRQSLSDQHSVKRITKGTWQRSCPRSVFNGDRQLIKTLVGDRPSEIECDCFRRRKSAQTILGGDLPRRCGADQYLVCFVRDCLLGSWRQPLASDKPPQQRMCVEERPHASTLPACEFGLWERIEETLIYFNAPPQGSESTFAADAKTYEARNWLSVPGNDDLVASFYLHEQARQLCLRLVDVHYGHRRLLTQLS